MCVNCGGGSGTPQRLTESESRAHMSLWALLKSPLLAGLDPSVAAKEDIAILTNQAVVAISQDELGQQGHMLSPRPLAAIPTAGDAAVLRPCNDSGSSSGAAPDAQLWKFDFPQPGNLGLQSISSGAAQLCLTVSNLTDKDSHRPMVLIQVCSPVGDVHKNQTFVYNESTRMLVHPATSMCVSRTPSGTQTRREIRPQSTSLDDDWWTHISDVGLHPYGNYNSSWDVVGVPTVSAQVAACSANCTATPTCYGWNLIKVN